MSNYTGLICNYHHLIYKKPLTAPPKFSQVDEVAIRVNSEAPELLAKRMPVAAPDAFEQLAKRLNQPDDSPEIDPHLFEGIDTNSLFPDLYLPDLDIPSTDHETIESLSKRNPNEVPEPNRPLAKRVQRKFFSQEEDQIILDGIKARKNYQQIAKELNLRIRQISERWLKFLSKEHPEVKYQPINKERKRIFTKELDKCIVDGIKAKKTYVEIAKELNIDPTMVSSRWIRVLSKKHPEITYRLAVVDPTTIFTQQTDQFIVDGIRAKKTYTQIARELNLYPQKIQKRWEETLSHVHPEVTYQPEYPVKRNKQADVSPKIDLQPLEDIDPIFLFTDLPYPELTIPVQNSNEAPEANRPFSKRSKQDDQTILKGIREGKTYEEIAEELNLDPRTVNSRWDRVLSKRHPEVTYQPEYPVKRNKQADVSPKIDLQPLEDIDPIFLFTDLPFPELTIPVQNPNEAPKTNRPFSRRSKQDDQTILKGIREGKTYEEIAEELNLRIRQISDRWVKVLSKQHPEVKYQPIRKDHKRTYTEEMDNFILAGIKANKSYVKIAEELNLDPRAVNSRWDRVLSKRHPELTYRSGIVK